MEPLDCWHCWGFELRSNHSCDQALGSDYDLGAIRLRVSVQFQAGGESTVLASAVLSS